MDENRSAHAETPAAWLPKRRLRARKPVWEARHAGRADTEVLGTWQAGGLVVRAAFDRLRAFDIATGEQRWDWDVPGRDVLSAMADDVVNGVALLVHRPDAPGAGPDVALTALDPDGGLAARIPSAGDIAMAPYASWVLADPRRWVTRAGDTLVTFARPPGDDRHPGTPAGFALSTGRHLWTWDDGRGVSALACHRGHLVALRHFEERYEGEHLAWRCRVSVLDPADGREVAHRRLRVTGDAPHTLHLSGNRLLWISKESRSGTPPVKAYDWH
jgi:hypothetical protein